jgi:hypothetical protein
MVESTSVWTILRRYQNLELITAAARSKARTVFARSNTVIVGSNSTQGMDVCMRLFLFVLSYV